uniref:Uncharacterized protein n=1 Tax=Timema bartmani TaxID=61472 RepID=A0A7R9F5S1_9NEOP|nr:unnamed protein product [Timema bartmani]
MSRPGNDKSWRHRITPDLPRRGADDKLSKLSQKEIYNCHMESLRLVGDASDTNLSDIRQWAEHTNLAEEGGAKKGKSRFHWRRCRLVDRWCDVYISWQEELTGVGGSRHLRDTFLSLLQPSPNLKVWAKLNRQFEHAIGSEVVVKLLHSSEPLPNVGRASSPLGHERFCSNHQYMWSVPTLSIDWTSSIESIARNSEGGGRRVEIYCAKSESRPGTMKQVKELFPVRSYLCQGWPSVNPREQDVEGPRALREHFRSGRYLKQDDPLLDEEVFYFEHHTLWNKDNHIIQSGTKTTTSYTLEQRQHHTIWNKDNHIIQSGTNTTTSYNLEQRQPHHTFWNKDNHIIHSGTKTTTSYTLEQRQPHYKDNHIIHSGTKTTTSYTLEQRQPQHTLWNKDNHIIHSGTKTPKSYTLEQRQPHQTLWDKDNHIIHSGTKTTPSYTLEQRLPHHTIWNKDNYIIHSGTKTTTSYILEQRQPHHTLWNKDYHITQFGTKTTTSYTLEQRQPHHTLWNKDNHIIHSGTKTTTSYTLEQRQPHHTIWNKDNHIILNKDNHIIHSGTKTTTSYTLEQRQPVGTDKIYLRSNGSGTGVKLSIVKTK